MNPTLAGLLALAVWSTFGVMFLFVKTLPVFEVLGVVFFMAYACFTILQLMRKENICSYWHQPFSYYAFWLAGAGLYTVLIYIAFKMAPIFEANILNYLWPILLVLFAALIYKDPLPLNRIIGMMLGFAGAVIILVPPHGEALFLNFSAGHFIAILAAIVWALYSVLTRNRNYPQGFQAPMFLILSLICFVVHLGFENTVMPDLKEWVFLFLLGGLRISYALWDYGMKKGNVTLLASMSYFLPLISSVFLISFGERPAHPLIGLGAALIIAGCLTVNADKIRRLLSSR
jgi:drug/metabolite transporter (DMT)-like permease